jgi:hypothetical protein
MVSMDFVEGLPRSGHYNCILVVVDKFSKFSHFIPLRDPFTALYVAKAFLDNVYKLHGMPASIVSDRDRVFTSNVWKELFGLVGVSLKMSSSYHPQTDGQTECVNQCMDILALLRPLMSDSMEKLVVPGRVLVQHQPALRLGSLSF